MATAWHVIPGTDPVCEVNRRGIVRQSIVSWAGNEIPNFTKTLSTSKSGYLYFSQRDPQTRKKRNFYVHTYIAAGFVPNPNNYRWIEFIDGNRANPEARNLQWVESRPSYA